MRAVAIIMANGEFISAFFFKLKVHNAEMAYFVTFIVYVFLLCEKNLKIAIDNSLTNLILRIFKKRNLKSVKKYDLYLIMNNEFLFRNTLQRFN